MRDSTIGAGALGAILVLSGRALAQPAPEPVPTQSFPAEASQPAMQGPLPTTPPPAWPPPAYTPPAYPYAAPPAAPPMPPDEVRDETGSYDWNLGVGVAGAGDSFGNFLTIGGSETPSVAPPAPRLSLERRLAGATWLLLNGVFSYRTFDTPVTDQSDTTSSRTTIEQSETTVTVLLGVRHAVVTGIVELSLFAAGGAAYTTIGGDELEPDERIFRSQAGSSATALEVVGGLAVERELIEALSLRLSTEIVSAAWAKSEGTDEADSTDEADRAASFSDAQLAVRLAPAVDIRFYF